MCVSPSGALWLTRLIGAGLRVFPARAVFGAVLVLLTASPALAQPVVYVDVDAAGVSDGSSWEDAYTDLQDALTAAADSGGTITEIWVAAGDYFPSERSDPEDPESARFRLIDGVAIQGGYAGYGAPDPDERDIALYETILNGDLDTHHVYHVVTDGGSGETGVLDGFTITGGRAFGSCCNDDRGGGMFLSDASPVIKHCSLVSNRAGNVGGAVWSRGGSPTFIGCTFRDHHLWGAGAAVHNVFGADLTLIDCVFEDNTLTSPYSSGAAVMNGDDSHVSAVGCTFLNNRARYSGAVANGGDAEFINCFFLGNVAEGPGGMGGAIGNGGSLTLTNCTLVGNFADTAGGGLYHGGENVARVFNSIAWGNSDEDGVGETSQLYSVGEGLLINYSCVQGWSGQLGGIGNTGEDPLFLDPEGPDGVLGTGDDDLHLQYGSPSVNTGSNYAPEFPTEDSEGNPRIQNCRVDMGPFESPYTPTTFLDCNNNVENDDCDVYGGVSQDCDENHIPDECDIATDDCNSNEIPDECDIDDGTSEDCNANGIPDECDLEGGTSDDCNDDLIPDECEEDCNDNGIPDDCDLADGTSEDCNDNLIPDECEPESDCNNNGIPDECEDLGGGSRLYVDQDAVGGVTGRSWGAALSSLQSALCFAERDSEVSEIRVAAGTYTPSQRTDPDDPRTATFYLINGLALEGGYAGYGEPNPDERDVAAYETVLSGDLNVDDGPDFENNVENAYHVVTGNGTDTSAVLDGFTITGGHADGPNAHYRGGGTYNETGSPTLIDCTFSANQASIGGGMSNYNQSNPTLINCTFSANRASRGGGMSNYDESNPTLINCTFNGNWSEYLGARNPPGGAGMYNGYNSNPTLTNCNFSGNATSFNGGAMFNFGSNPTLKGCTFSGNSAWYGGGMYNEFGSPTITCGTFAGNTADDGGGMYNWNQSTPTLANCTLADNSAAGLGGGMASYYESGPTLANCVLWANRDAGGSGESAQITSDETSAAVINHTCVQGWTGDLGGVGNIGDDPIFVEPGYWDDGGTPDDPEDDVWVDGNYRLQPDSPSINTGDPDFVPEPNQTDLDGHARVLCDRVDMGPYEFGIGDYNCDRSVDLTDFSYWIDCMTGPHSGPYIEGCEAFDFDADDDVDLTDFAGLQVLLTEGDP